MPDEKDVKQVDTNGKPLSFVDQVYDQLNNVLGGDSANQFLCLTIPGQALSAEDFAYDYKNNAPKGPTVEANEAHLANKLFDPAKVVGADNGLTLPYQYQSALDMLSPKLNAKITEAKNQLRELLVTEYPYKYSEDDEESHTLQEVFFHLYDEWIAAQTEWARIQNAKMDDLRRRYPGDDKESHTKFKDEYLTWYETEAAPHLNAINEKMAKVISVFTPNDMKILQGILDAGSGAELERAREVLNNIQKITPTGGYVYPVKFNPTNWFEFLDTMFTPIDILEQPDAHMDKIANLTARRNFITARIEDISGHVPEDSAVKEAADHVTECKTTLSDAQTALLKNYDEGLTTALQTVLHTASSIAGTIRTPSGQNILKSLLTNAGVVDNIDNAIEDFSQVIESGIDAQNDYVNATRDLADAMANSAALNAKAELQNVFTPLKEQLVDIDNQLAGLNLKVSLAASKAESPDTYDSPKNIMVPQGFTQIYIESNSANLTQATSQTSSSSVSTCGAGFLLCGYQSNKSKSSSEFEQAVSSENFSIEIGMNVAKVGIERDWFNPGIFNLTKDMFKVSTSMISQYENRAKEELDSRINDLAGENYVFPCYPTAFIVARDVSIRLKSSSNFSDTFAKHVEEHASSGGGFLFFSGSSASSSASSTSGVHTSSDGQTITLKFDTPQVIGYYMEITPPDQSVYLNEVDDEATKAGFVSIQKFVNDYMHMLEEMKKKTILPNPDAPTE